MAMKSFQSTLAGDSRPATNALINITAIDTAADALAVDGAAAAVLSGALETDLTAAVAAMLAQPVALAAANALFVAITALDAAFVTVQAEGADPTATPVAAVGTAWATFEAGYDAGRAALVALTVDVSNAEALFNPAKTATDSAIAVMVAAGGACTEAEVDTADTAWIAFKVGYALARSHLTNIQETMSSQDFTDLDAAVVDADGDDDAVDALVVSIAALVVLTNAAIGNNTGDAFLQILSTHTMNQALAVVRGFEQQIRSTM